MDALKDFFSDLKSRISNPFISSFVIAWIFRNYQVIVTLLFYKQSELARDGYKSYIDVIQKNYTQNQMIWFPLSVALGYTFVFPFFKSGIRLFESWIVTKTDSFVYTITKDEVVSVEIHSQVVNDLKEKKAQYADAISEEKGLKEQISGLNERVLEMSKNHTETVKALNAQHDKEKKELILEYDYRVDRSTQDLIEAHAKRLHVLESDNTRLKLELDAAQEENTQLKSFFDRKFNMGNNDGIFFNRGNGLSDAEFISDKPLSGISPKDRKKHNDGSQDS